LQPSNINGIIFVDCGAAGPADAGPAVQLQFCLPPSKGGDEPERCRLRGADVRWCHRPPPPSHGGSCGRESCDYENEFRVDLLTDWERRKL